jgi:hypothetical protein
MRVHNVGRQLAGHDHTPAHNALRDDATVNAADVPSKGTNLDGHTSAICTVNHGHGRYTSEAYDNGNDDVPTPASHHCLL